MFWTGRVDRSSGSSLLPSMRPCWCRRAARGKIGFGGVEAPKTVPARSPLSELAPRCLVFFLTHLVSSPSPFRQRHSPRLSRPCPLLGCHPSSLFSLCVHPPPPCQAGARATRKCTATGRIALVRLPSPSSPISPPPSHQASLSVPLDLDVLLAGLDGLLFFGHIHRLPGDERGKGRTPRLFSLAAGADLEASTSVGPSKRPISL